MDWKKVLLAGVKYFAVAFIGVLVAALVLATGFKPDGHVENVIWQYAVLPLIMAIIGALNNLIKHFNDVKK